MRALEEETTRPFRLTTVCHGYPPYLGGAENVAAFLAEQAALDQDIVSSVVTSTIGGRLPQREQRHGVDLCRVPAYKKAWTRHTVPELGLFFLSCRLRARALYDTLRPDYVLAHFTMPAGMLAALWHRRFGTPYAVVLHGSDVPGYQPSRFRLLHGVMRRIVRSVWASAERVIAVGQPLADLAGESWSGPITVIPNGVDDIWFRDHDYGARERFTVLVVAQLIERKGIQFLFEALADMREANPLVHVCGTGPYQETLRKTMVSLGLADHVVFHGSVDADHIRTLQDASDVFVLPALQEGLPLSLLEAMAAAMPVVATGVGDIGRVLQHEQNGLMVAPGNPAALAAALHVLYRDDMLRKTYGQAAQAAVAPHRWSCIWRRYREVLLPDGVQRPAHPVRNGD